jgi:hypothetical protein
MYTPLIIGNSCISEDLYSLGEMVICSESLNSCKSCKKEMEKYSNKIRPEILNLSKFWVKYVKEHNDVYLKSVLEDYDLEKISNIAEFNLN